MEREFADLLHRGGDNDQKVRYRYRYNVGGDEDTAMEWMVKMQRRTVREFRGDAYSNYLCGSELRGLLASTGTL